MSCKGTANETKSSPIIVKIGNRVLTEEQISTMIHPSASSEDSAAIANAYVDKWVRDQLLMKEAVKLYATDIEIERLVDDYRENLLKYRLEEAIITARFDTTITYNELFAFYNENKRQFPLSEDLFRAVIINVPDDSKSKELLQKAWKAGEIEKIIRIADSFALTSSLDTTLWMTWPEITKLSTTKFDYPGNKNGRMQSKKDDNSEFFLKIIEKVDKGDLSPLAYIENQLILMLRHKRKKEIIEKYNEELYERALQQNEIQL
jgi:hypothetical protein